MACLPVVCVCVCALSVHVNIKVCQCKCAFPMCASELCVYMFARASAQTAG